MCAPTCHFFSLVLNDIHIVEQQMYTLILLINNIQIS